MNPAFARVAEAGEYQWAANDTPGSIEFFCRPGADPVWVCRFRTVRVTRNGRPTRKGWRVTGDSIGACIIKADEIVFQEREQIEAGRTAWLAQHGIHP